MSHGGGQAVPDFLLERPNRVIGEHLQVQRLGQKVLLPRLQSGFGRIRLVCLTKALTLETLKTTSSTGAGSGGGENRVSMGTSRSGKPAKMYYEPLIVMIYVPLNMASWPGWYPRKLVLPKTRRA